MAKRMTTTERNCIKNKIMDSIKDTIEEKFSERPDIPEDIKRDIERANELFKQIRTLQEKKYELCDRILSKYGFKNKVSKNYVKMVRGTRGGEEVEEFEVFFNDGGYEEYRDKIEEKVLQELVISNLDGQLTCTTS